MSTFLLMLVLLGLITIGILMGPSLEYFANPPPTMTVATSPALANLLSTPILIEEQKPVVQVDTLARDQDIQHTECPKCPECKKCTECPDMSKYIRMNEVPCWNCTLP